MVRNNFLNNFKKWLMSIDQVVFLTTIILIAIGIWVSIASTPAVALKLGLTPFYFVRHHILLVPAVIFIIIYISTLKTKHIRLIALVGYFLCLLFITGTLLFGTEIKGAKRWLNIFGFSLQPSEFLKPSLTIITAWLVAEQYRDRNFPGILLSLISICITVPLLLLQPDVGMTVIILTTWVVQLFISGLSIFMIGVFVAASLASLFTLYFLFPHFTDRIDRFLTKGAEDTDSYQINKSIEAFQNGGLFGKGPGEGEIKMSVPDSHSDFVFSVIGEEFGFFMCIIIIALFAIITIKPIMKSLKSSSIFCYSSIFGIIFQIALQVIINMSSSLSLIPTKGMTLPFISYGGSSLLASAISIGIILALTKYNSLMHEVI